MELKIPVIQRVIALTMELRKPAIPETIPEIKEAMELTIPLKQEKIEPILLLFLYYSYNE